MTVWINSSGYPWKGESKNDEPVHLHGDGTTMMQEWYDTLQGDKQRFVCPILSGALADWIDENVDHSPARDRLTTYLRGWFNKVE